MTPQERQLLESLTSRIASTQIPQKDPEAETLITQNLGRVPDALYILTQTVLIQEMALNQANTRLHDLQQQIDTHRGDQSQPTSFLGRLFGTGASQRPPGPAQQFNAPPYDAPQYQVPQSQQYQMQPQGSSFLRNAAMTATGVAAGALAFEGIESLFGHHGGYGGGFGGNSFGGGEFLGGGPSETVVNNYYEEPVGGDHSGDRDQFASTDNTDFQQNDGGVGVEDANFDSSLDSSNDDFSSTDV